MRAKKRKRKSEEKEAKKYQTSVRNLPSLSLLMAEFWTFPSVFTSNMVLLKIKRIKLVFSFPKMLNNG